MTYDRLDSVDATELTTSVEPGSVRDRHSGAVIASRLRPSRDSLRRLLELFVLTAFAITQPLLDVTGRAPEFFVFRRADRTDVVLFLLIVTFAPTLVLWVVEQVVGLAGVLASRAVHLLFVTLLLTALAIQVAKKLIPDRGYSLLALGLVCGAAGTVLLLRSSTLRMLLSYLTPAPLIFALLFLLSPVGALITSSTATSNAHALGGGPRPPIVMIFFDEFPTISLLNSKGLVDERVYPNFARLQQDSVWFRHATAVAGWTAEALPPMLTGRYATKKLAPSYVQFPDNLFTLLSDDYQVVASESVAQLCPPSACKAAPLQRETGLLPVLRESTATARLLVSPLKSTVEPGDQFAEEEDSGEQAAASPPESHRANDLWFRHRQLGKQHQPSRVTDFLDSLEATDQPTLRFLHVLLPHGPFTHLPSGASYPNVPRSFHHTHPSTTGTATGGELSMRQRHLLNVAYTDALLGAVIDRLEQQGLYESSLIVTTADHGVWFEHGTNHEIDRNIDPKTQASAPEVAYVPTFVKLPGTTKGRIDDRNWENIDLVPTIADVLDVKIPWRVDGVSGLGPDLRKTDDKRFNFRQKTVHFSDRKATPRLLAGVTDKLARPEHGVAGLYEYGPYRALVNKQVGDLPVSGASPGRATVDLGASFTVEPKSGIIPAMIYGRATGVPAGTPVAIAVNGTISAVPMAFSGVKGSMTRFAGMVFDERFKAGRNTLRLFVVEGTPNNPVLRPLHFARR